MKKTIYLCLSGFVISCATGGKKDGREAGKRDKGGEERGFQRASEDEFYVSGNFKTVTTSRSNSKETGFSVDQRQANELVKKLETSIKSAKEEDRKDFVALMSAQRLAGNGLKAVMQTAERLVALEMKKDKERGIPEFARLELVLASIQANKYSFAEYYLYELQGSNNKSIKAAAFTAEGIINALDGRLPEAVESWQAALKVEPSYPAARLNLGFMALKYGDFARAKEMLGDFQDNWFAAYGLISAERHTGGTGKANQLCKRVLDERPQFKPAILNCALNEFEGNAQDAPALVLLDRLSKSPGFPEVEKSAFKLRKAIESQQRQVQKPKKQRKPKEGKRIEQAKDEPQADG